jgi:copper(I)-binding protein
MLKHLSSLLLMVTALSNIGLGQELKVADTWIQAIPPGSDATAAYMTILNTGGKALQLVGASSPAAAKIEPMLTTEVTEKGQKVMGMESVPIMAIAPGEKLVLKPGGNHLMLIGLTEQIKEGDQIRLTLRFSPGDRSIDLIVPAYKHAPK